MKKFFTKLTTLLIALTLSTSLMAQGYSGGDGTSGNPYQIANKTDLKYLSEITTIDELAKHFIQTADIYFIASDFASGGDFYNEGKGFKSIGWSQFGFPAFVGTYDGQNHIVDGLFINSNLQFIGFFGIAGHNSYPDAEISNLGLTNVNITSTNTNVGGLVGWDQGTTISNCFTTGSVIGGTERTGGLVGFGANVTISNCNSNCTVHGGGYVGGLVGYVSGNSSISNSFSSGAVTKDVNGTNIGGLVGYFDSSTSTSSNCFWDTETSGQSSSACGTGKTTAQMKTLSTFNTVWDFIGSGGTDDYWSMDGTTNSGYPFLSWEAQCWDGGNSKTTDWFTSSNWQSGYVPTSGDDVSISNTTVMPTISGLTTAECNNLVVASGSTLTIDYDGTLTVGNNLTNSGTFAVNSTSAGTGSLIVEGTATGDVTAQRYITGNSNDWHLLSSPVTEQEISGNFTDALGYDFYMYYEVENLWVNKKNTTVAPTWNTANGDINFTPAQGYMVAYTDANSNAKSFTGELNQGTVSIALTKTGTEDNSGSNLVGNPYSSSINWKASSGWTRTMLRDDGGGTIGYSMYIYNETAGNYGTFVSNGSSGTNSVTQYIPPMQGFFVVAASAGSLQMTEDICVHNGADNWLKNTLITNEIVRFKVSNENYGTDEVIIELNEEATGGAPKMMSMVATAPSLWLDNNSKLYSILFASQEQKQNGFPLSFKAGADGVYKINIDSEITQTEVITLEDKQLGIFYNLSQNPDYELFSSVNDDANRFVLHFGSTGIEDEETIHTNTIRTYASNNTLYILNPNQKRGTVTIYNLTGQTVATFELTGDTKQQQTINTNNVINIVKIQSNNEVISEKVISR